MYLIVGLGNPGRQYEATRHNMGFDVIDKLVEEYQVPQAGVKFNAMYGKGRIGGQPVILMKPLSYMNLSGGPIREMANYFKIDPETEMIVIYDDIDLDPGQLRIRKKAVQAVIMESNTLYSSSEHRTLCVSKLALVRSQRAGIWLIMCWEDLIRMTVSLSKKRRRERAKQLN